MASVEQRTAGMPGGGNLPQGILNVPGLRPLLLLIGIAAAVAAGVSIVLWAQGPDFTPVYGSLDESDAWQMSEVLKGAGIPSQIDGGGSVIAVPAGRVDEARLLLAGQGLPRGGGVGIEMIHNDQGFGTSQFMEKARYHHALETEMARTISRMNTVSSARVHLAMPRESSFVRERRPPSASIFLQLHAGRQLETAQVAAIVHLVASSVPGMDYSHVSVIDQQGRLLTRSVKDEGESAFIKAQFEQARNFETILARRVEDLLTPVVGFDRVRVQVHAEMDFSTLEQTQEIYGQDGAAVRSEQIENVVRNGTIGQGAGIPGALSNQPPVNMGNANERPEEDAGNIEDQRIAGIPRRSVRNFELDRTISHKRQPAGMIQRLSVAVVVDDMAVVQEDGTRVLQPLGEERLAEITELVRDAVGYNPQRGDSVRVVNASFQSIDLEGAQAESSMLDNIDWYSVIRLLVGAAIVLVLALGVLRPMLRNLTSSLPAPRHQTALPLPHGELSEPQQALSSTAASGKTADYEQQLTATRAMAHQDPKRVAQVVKGWVSEDG